MGVSFNLVVDQIGRLIESLGVQPTQTHQRSLRVFEELEGGNNERSFRPRRVEVTTYEEEEFVEQYEPRPFVVRRNQDIDRVLRNSDVGRNNIVNVVEEVLTRSGVNVGLRRPNYSSPFPDYIRLAELPRGVRYLNLPSLLVMPMSRPLNISLGTKEKLTISPMMRV